MKYIILILLMSCSTSYQPKGFTGGFSEMKMAEDIYEVSFTGNGYTGSDTVNKYLLKRCAEITLDNGYTHFVLINRNGSTDTTLNASSSYGSTSIGTINRHSGTALIKMMSNPRKDMIAFDAETVFGEGKRKSASLPKWE